MYVPSSSDQTDQTNWVCLAGCWLSQNFCHFDELVFMLIPRKCLYYVGRMDFVKKIVMKSSFCCKFVARPNGNPSQFSIIFNASSTEMYPSVMEIRRAFSQIHLSFYFRISWRWSIIPNQRIFIKMCWPNAWNKFVTKAYMDCNKKLN